MDKWFGASVIVSKIFIGIGIWVIYQALKIKFQTSSKIIVHFFWLLSLVVYIYVVVFTFAVELRLLSIWIEYF